MKKMAARNFEDLLQVRVSDVKSLEKVPSNFMSYLWQCAIPAFEGLLPSHHNEIVMTLLYRLAEWHALAKLRMHTDPTLSLLDSVTTILGRELRQFRQIVCSAYSTTDLPKERAARQRKKQRDQAKTAAHDSSNVPGDSSIATKPSSAQTPVSQADKPSKLSCIKKIIDSQFVHSKTTEIQPVDL
jgi:hypothetical protein